MDKKEKMRKVLSTLLSAKYELQSFSPRYMIDADFSFRNGEYHYRKRLEDGDIPKTMTLKEYMTISKNVSLKQIGVGGVRAYKTQGRIKKWDGMWFVVYSGGTIVSSYPLRGGRSRFERLLDRENGVEISRE